MNSPNVIIDLTLNDFLAIGYTLPNQANTCLPKSTDAYFCSIAEGDQDLWEKIPVIIRGPSTVSTRKAVADETFVRN